MTATLPQHGPPAPGGPPGDARDCALYRFWVKHPVTGGRVLGYVGETVRLPFVRLMEHVLQQPWADTIIGWEVDPTTYAGKDAVLAAERAAVESERPLYNVEWNLGNPDRVKPWVAQEQRAARDQARGYRPSTTPRPPSTPVQRRPVPSRTVNRPSRLGRWAERRTRKLRRRAMATVQAVVVLAAVWAVLLVVLVAGFDTAGRDAAGMAGVGVAGLYALWRKIK